METAAQHTRLLNRKQQRDRIPVSDATLARWEREGVLPPPTRIRGRPYQTEAAIERLARGGQA